MIHTMTIQRELEWTAAKNILKMMEIPDYELIPFLTGHDGKNSGKIPATRRRAFPWPGITEISVSRSVRPMSDGNPFTTYFCYVRMEPLTVITREKNIALFECTEENIRRLQNEFRIFMSEYLQLDGTPTVMNDIAELATWDGNRIDYTRDIRMNNHDEVLALMNLCKMSILSTKQKGALAPTSIYDKHFHDDMFKFGNNSWEVEIYDKQAEIMNNRKKYIEDYGSEDIYERLYGQSEFILRFEYRRKYDGIKKDSTKLESKNIMEFLTEDLADKWFHEFYGEHIGYEPFYVLDYQLNLKLAAGFPMTKEEVKQENARRLRYDHDKEIAAKEGKRIVPYKKEILGHKAKEHRAHIALIAEHNGMQNALNSYAKSSSTFKAFNKRIRERAGVSPVVIPKNWVTKREDGTGRGMNIPKDFLPNPIKKPDELVRP